MIWRIYDLVSAANNPNADFVKDLPILALTTTLELWLCIIIACIPTIGPIMKTLVKPVVERMTGKSNSEGVHDTPLHMVTFGRGRFGSRSRHEYTDVLESQDPGEENHNSSEGHRKMPSTARELGSIRKDTVTTSDFSPWPLSGETPAPFSAEVTANHRIDNRHHPSRF